jgi:DNA-binding transcriptional regulator/RsmH inhibitor MraZ
VSQVRFEGSGPPAPLEHRRTAVARPVEQSGRITLPPEARHVFGTQSFALAATRGGMLVLHDHGAGASLAIDGRGRLLLPAWLRAASRSSGSVPVAARAAGLPAVVLTPTDVLDDLLSHVVAEAM